MDTFYLQLLLSFIIGGIWIGGTTILTDRYGSKLGGWLGGLPSTTLFSLFFIALSQSPSVASEVTIVMPLIIAFAGIFALLFVLSIHKGLAPALLLSLGVWTLLSMVVVLFGLESFTISVVLYLLFVAALFFLFSRYVKVEAIQQKPFHYSTFQMIIRSLFGGAIIALAVYLSKVSGPIIGGVFAAFPALFLSSLVIVYLSQGAKFVVRYGKTLGLSGVINVGLYTIVARFTYMTDDLWIGTGLAMVIASITGFITYKILKKEK